MGGGGSLQVSGNSSQRHPGLHPSVYSLVGQASLWCSLCWHRAAPWEYRDEFSAISDPKSLTVWRDSHETRVVIQCGRCRGLSILLQPLMKAGDSPSIVLRKEPWGLERTGHVRGTASHSSASLPTFFPKTPNPGLQRPQGVVFPIPLAASPPPPKYHPHSRNWKAGLTAERPLTGGQFSEQAQRPGSSPAGGGERTSSGRWLLDGLDTGLTFQL